jgi:GT2 family glycosyltransferase
MKTDIVIVNWNSGDQLRECLDSVLAYGDGYVAQLIVVDNGSTDGSAAFAQGAYDVDLVLLGRNLGFGAACNLGAARGDAEFVLFLNPDAKLCADTLANVATFVTDSREDGATFGVQLLNDLGEVERSCSRFPTVLRDLVDSVGLSKLYPRLGMKMSEWDHQSSRDVDQVIGAFFLTRRNIFESLGGFDERFFVYFEEVDLSYRSRLAGFRSHYIAEAQAYHKGGGVSEQVKAHRLFYSLRSRILYARKHFSMAGALAVAGSTLGPELIARGGHLALRRAWGEFGDLWRGYRMLWSWAWRTGAGRRPSDWDRSAG